MQGDHRNQKDLLRPHEADGIQEYDNPMPRWWIGLFWATIMVAVVYMTVIHGLKDSTLIKELNEKSVVQPAPQVQGAEVQSLASLVKDPETLAEGKSLFQSNCMPCHGPSGEGGIGPNLTDTAWINVRKIEDLPAVIANGVLDKGMPPWASILGDKKVRQTAAFVLSLQGSKPANGKAAQGEAVTLGMP